MTLASRLSVICGLKMTEEIAHGSNEYSSNIDHSDDADADADAEAQLEQA